MEEMKIALVQMESLLDRPAENLAKMARFIAAAAARGAKMICFPELNHGVQPRVRYSRLY